MQVDGRPLGFNELIFGNASLWDVQQVEVFRGPQSTIQGRNSIAGAVVLKTNDPTYYTEGAAQFQGGELDERQGSAMRSEARGGGKESGSEGRSRWRRYI